MSVRTKNLKLVGVGSAVALTIGAIAAPAMAAPQNLTYDCAVGSPVPLGPVDSTIDVGAIPATLVAGQAVTQDMSLVFHLNTQQTAIAQSVGTSVKGTIKAKGPLAFKLKIPDTAIPQAPGSTMDATASGKGTIMFKKAGKMTLVAPTTHATLDISGGAQPVTATETCTAPTNGDQDLGTVTVTKDKSKTVVAASYNGKKDKATGTATVKGKTYQLPGTGKVTFKLMKGGTVKDTAKDSLNAKGKASVDFKNVKKAGTYTIKASFGGDKGLKGSSGSDTFTVK